MQSAVQTAHKGPIGDNKASFAFMVPKKSKKGEAVRTLKG